MINLIQGLTVSSKTSYVFTSLKGITNLLPKIRPFLYSHTHTQRERNRGAKKRKQRVNRGAKRENKEQIERRGETDREREKTLRRRAGRDGYLSALKVHNNKGDDVRHLLVKA